MAISFHNDVLPLFRRIDINHMRPLKVLLDDYAYMSDPTADSTHPDHAHAQNVLCYLTGECTPRMPIGGPFWTDQQLDLLRQWMADGYLP